MSRWAEPAWLSVPWPIPLWVEPAWLSVPWPIPLWVEPAWLSVPWPIPLWNPVMVQTVILMGTSNLHSDDTHWLHAISEPLRRCSTTAVCRRGGNRHGSFISTHIVNVKSSRIKLRCHFTYTSWLYQVVWALTAAVCMQMKCMYTQIYELRRFVVVLMQSSDTI